MKRLHIVIDLDDTTPAEAVLREIEELVTRLSKDPDFLRMEIEDLDDEWENGADDK